jgi:imidazolonepropionase-like amidohydrolase
MLKRIFKSFIAAGPVNASCAANHLPEPKSPRFIFACGLLAVILSVDARAQGSSRTASLADREFVIRHARIFDGSRVIPDGDVWVKDGMIAAVGPAGLGGKRIQAPSGVRVVDASGRTLLPGLIDAHVHTMGLDTFLKSALALGVTTELDMGSAPQYADKIEKEQAAGNALDLADLRSSRTQPTAPDGHGTEYGIPIPTISSPDEAQALVDRLIGEGADFIAEIVYDDGSEFGLRLPTLSKETLRAVIAAAHRRGKLAVVHVLSLQGAKDAIAAGADGLAHLFADRAADEEFFALAAQHHTFVIPTLSVLASMAGVSAGPSLARDPRLQPYLSPDAIADLKQDVPRHVGTLRYAEEAVRRLNAAQIPILAGTDGHNAGTAHGASLHGELQLLVDSGLTPVQALASATSVNAAAFQLNDRGQIAPGKRADLLLVDGDPTSRISDISNVAAVWKLGVRFDREAYRASLDKEKEAERAQIPPAPPAGSASGLVSDFEDGTAATKFGIGWAASTGRLLGGHSPEAKIEVVDGGSGGSGKALQITGEITPGVFGWAGAMFFPGSAPMVPVNLSNKNAISFWTKGDGRTYQVMLWAKSAGALPMTKSFTAGPEWKRVSLPLTDFGTDGHDLKAVMIAELAVPGKFAFLVDDIRLEAADSPARTPASISAAPFAPDRATDAGAPTTKTARSSEGAWEIDGTLYFWLQGIHGNVDALGQSIGFRASPKDLASYANFGLQGLVEARYKRLILANDVLWTPLTVSKSEGSVFPLPPGFTATVKYTPVVLTHEVGYRLIDSARITVDGFTGVRHWHLGAALSITPSPDGSSHEGSSNWADPLAGARIQVPITSKLRATIWGDAGGWGAGSQMDYQMVGGLRYQLKPRWALDAAWRYLYDDYRQDQLHTRTAQSGLLLGVTYRIK